MAIPNMVSAFDGWVEPLQYLQIQNITVDFEEVPTVVASGIVYANLQPLPPEEIAREIEYNRNWKYFTVYVPDFPQNAEVQLSAYDIVVENNIGYQIQEIESWFARRAGYNLYVAIQTFEPLPTVSST